MIDTPTPKTDQTLWEEMRARGVTRRDFIKFCTWMAAYMGLESSGVAQVARALEKNKRIPIIWLHFQECTCCSESFIRSSHPIVADILLDKVSLDYTETLQAAAGHQAEAIKEQTMKESYGEYILMVEGSVPMEEDGVYCCIGGKSAQQILEEAAAGAKAIVAWGNCACAGCVQSANPNPTGARSIKSLIKNKPIVNVQGCPPIAEVMAGTVVHLLAFGRIPQLDALGRPKAFYSRRVHDTCYRRPYYDAGLFVESFDDENAKRGYCLYKMGCRGPTTYNSCGIIRWNNGTSFPIQSGHGCIGCSEEGFWDQSPFYKRLAGFPGFGIETTADKIGVGLGVATAVGIAAHATMTNIRKRKTIGQQPGETETEAEQEESNA
ncbi:hydrogenase small subunit [Puniceicoccales bacterium CK1056]|uniref:Hydrogenase small subunit n=2 Tax=Oceanipulchritudo coccoides TaxID=2706888 RepID=A0A6B2M252_9BACT|nr:hydrogenase small subunit [Oceanipulchritudo coccoides]